MQSLIDALAVRVHLTFFLLVATRYAVMASWPDGSGLMARSPWDSQANVPCATIPQRPATLTRDSSGIRIVESGLPLAARDALTILDKPSLELGGRGSAATLTRIAGATRLGDGSVVVGDDLPVEVRVFDATGRALRRLGRAGQGPGEYQRVSSILRLPGDTILISDAPRQRLYWFDQRGALVRTTEYAFIAPARGPASDPRAPRGDPAAIEFLGRFDDGSFLISTIVREYFQAVRRGNELTSRQMLLMRLSASGQKVDTISRLSREQSFSVPSERDPVLRSSVGVPFFPHGSIAAGSNGFYQTAGARYEIERRDVTGNVIGIFRLCKAAPAFSSADVARWRREYIATAVPSARPRFEAIARAIPYPRVRPAITQLLVDNAGRVWAREYGFPGDVQIWQVFANDGHHIGEVKTPAGVRVLEVGTDYVLGIAQDADMVQSLRLYRASGGFP